MGHCRAEVMRMPMRMSLFIELAVPWMVNMRAPSDEFMLCCQNGNQL